MESAKNSDMWRNEAQASDMQQEQALSAFMDSEDDSLQMDLQLEAVRERWAIYHVIGETMREPSDIRPVTSAFAARMAAALARESMHGPSHVSDVRSQPVPAWRRAFMAWPGVAVAAAVASVIWVAQPLFGVSQEPNQAMTFAQMESVAAPLRTIDEVEPQADYVSAHRQVAGPIGVRQLAFMPGAD